MKKLLIILSLFICINAIGQITTASYTNKGVTTPFINASSYRLNGVTQTFSQWHNITGGMYYNSGTVGIGLNTPSLYSMVNIQHLEDAAIAAQDYYGIKLYSDVGGLNMAETLLDYYGMKIDLTNTSDSKFANGIGLYVNVGAVGFANYPAIFMGGNVGINTVVPNYTLDVNGTIRTTSYLTQQGIYAGIYVSDASTAQSIANGTTYTKSTAFTTNGLSANCTSDAANDKITITKAGKYMILGTCSFTSGANNVIWRSATFLGGVEKSNIHWAIKVGTGSDVGSASFMGIINVTSVPVDLDVRFRHDQAGAINLTVVYSNLTVNYIGE